MSESLLNELLADLPAKQRVHELAKRAGLTSKQVLGALADAGYVAKSSQSSVDAEYATIALNLLLGSNPAPVTDAPAESAALDETSEPIPAFAAPEPPVASEPTAGDPASQTDVEAGPDAGEPTATAAQESKPKRSRGGRGRSAKKNQAEAVAESDQPAEFDQPAESEAVQVQELLAAPAAGNPVLEAALADLPARSRVHELAKRAGISAKTMLAALGEQGVVAKSANSVISLEQATATLSALLGGSDSAAASAADVTIADVLADLPFEIPTPDFSAPEVDAPQQTATETGVGPIFIAPDETARPARRRRGRGPADRADKASGADTADAAAEPNLLDLDSILDAAVAAGTVVVPPNPNSDATDAPAAAEDENSDESRRRRRRGRRGRGRAYERDAEDRAGSTDDRATDGASESDGDEPTTEADSEGDFTSPAPLFVDASINANATPNADATDDEDESDDSEETGDSDGTGAAGATSRRRRRRRSRGTSDDAPRITDDPIDTVVHVREPKSVESQVQGVRGSTRLEAKRQRRRDSRDTRRRPQILTEAEFLARRESVERVMAVRQRGDLAQVALLEDGVLVEHFVSRAGSASMIGNVYLGRVQNVLPSMEAAFVDIGRGRNAVLYAGEVNWDAAGLAGKSRKIETALSSGDTLLVQVSKDPVGHKGSRLTTQISLPGRFLVYVPNGGATGISRKLPDTERRRLKAILDRIVPEDAGVIIRTAAEGVSEEELARDVERLKLQWAEISKRASQKSNAPEQLYSEPDTLIKVIRDLFNSDITKLIIDGEQAWESLSAYVSQVAPELADRVSKFEGRTDVFSAHRIDEQIAKALERKVHLPSGGSLVIDRTEAMTVVDVNTGKYTGSGGNLEETVTKNNLEAAEEVVRQLRLRDIGGIIVVDFIDMVLESNRDLVLRRLTECLGRDRTRHQVAEVTSLGLIQMTRKKMGTGLVEAFSEPCDHCHGRGIVLHDVPIDMGVPEFAVGPVGGDRGGNQSNSGDRRRRGGSGNSQGGSGQSGGGQNRDSGYQRDNGPVAVIDAEAVALASSLPQVTPPQRDPRGPKPPSFAEKKAAREAAEQLAAEADQLINAADSAAAVETTVDEFSQTDAVAAAEAGSPETQAPEIALSPTEPADGPAQGDVADSESDSDSDRASGSDSHSSEDDTTPAIGELPVSGAHEAANDSDPARPDAAEPEPAPESGGRNSRRRGGRAAKRKAGAPDQDRSRTEATNGSADQQSNGHAQQPAQQVTAPASEPVPAFVVTREEAAVTATVDPVAVPVTVPAAAEAPQPRRRRAASRPAGPPQT